MLARRRDSTREVPRILPPENRSTSYYPTLYPAGASSHFKGVKIICCEFGEVPHPTPPLSWTHTTHECITTTYGYSPFPGCLQQPFSLRSKCVASQYYPLDGRKKRSYNAENRENHTQNTVEQEDPLSMPTSESNHKNVCNCILIFVCLSF